MFGLSATAIAGLAVGAAGVAAAGINYAAGSAQEEAALAAMSEQERMQHKAMQENNKRYEEFKKLMTPYMNAGNSAFKQQQALAGLGSPSAQRFQINSVASSPEYQQMIKSGENAILQNASATGGLRGGNTQAALATLSPAILNQLVNQRYNRLQDVAGIGINASNSLGQSGMNLGAQNGQIYQNIGDARASGMLGAAQAQANQMGAISQGIGAIAGGVSGYYQNMPVQQNNMGGGLQPLAGSTFKNYGYL